ncbi:hypothetical protein CCACVL1_30426, partial [Corchorus capsularis]
LLQFLNKFTSRNHYLVCGAF